MNVVREETAELIAAPRTSWLKSRGESGTCSQCRFEDVLEPIGNGGCATCDVRTDRSR